MECKQWIQRDYRVHRCLELPVTDFETLKILIVKRSVIKAISLNIYNKTSMPSLKHEMLKHFNDNDNENDRFNNEQKEKESNENKSKTKRKNKNLLKIDDIVFAGVLKEGAIIEIQNYDQFSSLNKYHFCFATIRPKPPTVL